MSENGEVLKEALQTARSESSSIQTPTDFDMGNTRYYLCYPSAKIGALTSMMIVFLRNVLDYPVCLNM